MAASNNHGSRRAAVPGDLKGVHILLVEDAWQVGESLKGLLQSAGATVAGPAATTAEANRLMFEHAPDVALVDFHLRGGELAGDLIHRLNEQGVNVVVISGYENLPTSTVRVAGFLRKPFTDIQLLATLQPLITPKRNGNP
jgi:DNA-binding NtrC family response regulator